jgi:hypothetical protein
VCLLGVYWAQHSFQSPFYSLFSFIPIIDLIYVCFVLVSKQRAIPILGVVFGTRNPIAFVLLAIFFPSGFRLVGNDIPDDVADFIFGISAIISVFLDPLFMYVPLINEDTKCVMLDYRLKIAAIVFRLFGDIKYVFRIYFRIKRGLQESRRRQESHSLMKIPMSVANDMVCILPIPQVREPF